MKYKGLVPILGMLLLATTVACNDSSNEDVTQSENIVNENTNTSDTSQNSEPTETSKDEKPVVETKTLSYIGNIDKYPIHMT